MHTIDAREGNRMVAPERRRQMSDYTRENLKQVIFRCHKVKDADIIEYLDSLDNRQGEIKRILRKEIARIESGRADV